MRTVARPVRILAVAAAGAALAVGCGSSGGGSGSSGGGTSDSITIKSFQFSQATVKPGAVVKVTNDDSAAHNVFSDKFKTTNIAQNETATFTAPTTPGTYDYICSIHTYMKGTLTVSAGS